MSRGRERQIILPKQPFYQAFLATIAEPHNWFDAHIRAYCLMKNHYHIMVENSLC
jgi:hypothetical protein